MNKALLVIDMLNDFSKKEGTLFVPENERIIPIISKWINKFREKGDYIIFVSDNHSVDDKEFSKWPPHAIAGTWGSEIVEELKPKLGTGKEFIVKKTTYSSFYKTELEELLKKLNVYELYLTGCVVNICVYYAAMEAVLRGFKVFVVKDAVSAIDEKDKDYVFKDMKNVLGVDFV
jgi:nicotinamidase-related amidase